MATVTMETKEVFCLDSEEMEEKEEMEDVSNIFRKLQTHTCYEALIFLFFLNVYNTRLRNGSQNVKVPEYVNRGEFPLL